MSKILKAFVEGSGILHLVPTWVPRPFNEPGHRLRLHPDDLYALGMERGGICERWINSVTKAMNGPLAGEYEGLSFVVVDEGTKELVLFRDCVEELGAELIGEELQMKYGTWPSYSKLYDYNNPLFHHLHLTEDKAALIGMKPKPEAYYFPVQYNSAYLGRMPLTYFGFDPSTTPEEVKECIRNYDVTDNRITELSRAFRIKLGTGWYTPAGIAHAPASLVTYEPQWNSDVNTILENVTMGEVNGHNLLVGCQPEEEKGDVEALFAQLDWEENIRPDYKAKYFREPKVRRTNRDVVEKWVAYANDYVAAKEVTIAPDTEAVITDAACYGALIVQGHGQFGSYVCESPELIRFGQLTGDEFFVSEKAAKEGVVVKNISRYEPLVFLQNFSNNNKEVPQSV